MSDPDKANDMPRCDEDFRDYVCKSFRDGKDRMDAMDAKIDANNLATELTASNTKELVLAFNAVKGGFTVLGWIGSIAKPIGLIAIAIGAITAAWNGWFHDIAALMAKLFANR